MLAAWEREHPGRTEAIFSALRNVSTSHLADPTAFDFAGLEARREAALALLDDEDAVDSTSEGEPWEEGA